MTDDPFHPQTLKVTISLTHGCPKRSRYCRVARREPVLQFFRNWLVVLDNFLFHPYKLEMIQFDFSIVFKGLVQPPTSRMLDGKFIGSTRWQPSIIQASGPLGVHLQPLAGGCQKLWISTGHVDGMSRRVKQTSLFWGFKGGRRLFLQQQFEFWLMVWLTKFCLAYGLIDDFPGVMRNSDRCSISYFIDKVKVV